LEIDGAFIMNKAKKEEARKLRQAHETMSAEELQEFKRKRRIQSLAEQLHSEMFPEEYDFMMDSISDAKDRRRGKNPMSAEYTEQANARREKLGVPPLGANGLPKCRSSWHVALAEAEKRCCS
jgi:hypothetical protein